MSRKSYAIFSTVIFLSLLIGEYLATHYPKPGEVLPPDAVFVLKFDKLLHATAYLVLTISFLTMLYCWQVRSNSILIFASLVGFLAWGAWDEYSQTFVPGRYGEVADLIADMFGVLIGLALFFVVRSWVDLSKQVATEQG